MNDDLLDKGIKLKDKIRKFTEVYHKVCDMFSSVKSNPDQSPIKITYNNQELLLRDNDEKIVITNCIEDYYKNELAKLRKEYEELKE